MSPPVWQYIKQGDSEAAAINILKVATEITTFPGAAIRVSGDMVGYEMGLRWIKVSREGGSMVWPKVDKPRLDFNVMAATRTDAHDIAQVAQAVMFRAMGQGFPTYGLFLSDVTQETGMFRADDPKTGSPRYVFALRLTVVPL